MPKQPIPQRLSYQDHVIQIDLMVHDALRAAIELVQRNGTVEPWIC